MNKAASKMPWISLWAVVVIVALCGVGLCWAAMPPVTTLPERADVITIDTLASFGPLERPVVIFPHDQHTQALEKQEKDCLTCHKADKERLSTKFSRLDDTDKDTVMDIYHDECIRCHSETKDAGPLTCGECHAKTPRITSSRQPMGMDKSLHYRHVKANDKRCEVCHHEYDQKEKKLFYAKGKEGTCRYCHRQESEENRISMRLASHMSCVDCHRKKLAENMDSGPIQCASCHDAEAQMLIAKLDEVPRMERGQPDAVFVKTLAEENNPATESNPAAARMNPVPFDHKAHEQYTDNCRACHHESLNACAACHAVGGAKEGGFVKLEQAMHRTTTDASCVGCHAAQKQAKECAGCHATMPIRDRSDDAACISCHRKVPVLVDGNALHMKNSWMATLVLKSRMPVSGTYGEADIPEVVVMKSLQDKYEPAEFPHRKVVDALMKNVGDNQLARYFHTGKGTLCQGCHHNSPPARKPPACVSCHGPKIAGEGEGKPALVGAYHQQCIGCHERMGITKPASRDCTACHIEKRQW
jgi:Class III cytochrome C family